MTASTIWALVALVAVVAAWDMVRRWSFATATRTLKADLDTLRADLEKLGGSFTAGRLPERVKQLETVVLALKTHAETQRAARPNPFLRKGAG